MAAQKPEFTTEIYIFSEQSFLIISHVTPHTLPAYYSTKEIHMFRVCIWENVC